MQPGRMKWVALLGIPYLGRAIAALVQGFRGRPSGAGISIWLCGILPCYYYYYLHVGGLFQILQMGVMGCVSGPVSGPDSGENFPLCILWINSKPLETDLR